jgi:glutaredoxin
MAASPRTPSSLWTLVVLVVGVSLAAQWIGDRAQGRVGDAVAAAARPGDIRMVSSLTCPYCTQARQWFEQHSVPVDECFVERDPACQALFDSLPVPATPTLIVRGQVQTGFDPQRLLAALGER